MLLLEDAAQPLGWLFSVEFPHRRALSCRGQRQILVASWKPIESAQFHHDEPDLHDPAAAVDAVAALSVAGARRTGDCGIDSVCAGLDYGRGGRLPGAQAGADHHDGYSAGSAGGQDHGGGGVHCAGGVYSVDCEGLDRGDHHWPRVPHLRAALDCGGGGIRHPGQRPGQAEDSAADCGGDQREMAEQLKNKLGSCAIVLAVVDGDKVNLVAGVSKDKIGQIKAGDLVNFVATQVGGKGGGKPDLAMAGGNNPAGLATALAGVSAWVEGQLGKVKG